MRTKNTEPLVGVIIPVYNRSDKICAAVNSVLGQNYPNIELIVVDDGSTDNTAEVLKKYGDRIRVLHQLNNGPAVARNHGTSASKGEIIAFLDSDDVYLPGKIERQVKVLQKCGEDVPCCLCNSIVEYDGKKTTSFERAPLEVRFDECLFLNVTEVLVTRFVLFNQTVAIRRWAWEKVGGFNTAVNYMEDHEMALQLSLLGPWALIREPLVVYRFGGCDAMSGNVKNERAKFQQDMVDIYMSFLRSSQFACGPLYRHIRSNIRRARCRVRIANSDGDTNIVIWPWAALLGWEKIKLRLARRMPWYPRVKQQRFAAANKERTAICRD